MKLDDLIAGRVLPGVIHLFGGAGTGKTSIAMACALSVAKNGGRCAWIDTTRGFSKRRFMTMATTSIIAASGAGTAPATAQVLHARVSNPFAMERAINQIVQARNDASVRLVVVDTAFGWMNPVDKSDKDNPIAIAAWRAGWAHAGDLLGRLALLSSIAPVTVLLTNTVGFKPSIGDHGQVRPTGGTLLSRLGAEHVMLSKRVDVHGSTGSLGTQIAFTSGDDHAWFTTSDEGILPIDHRLEGSMA